MYSVVARGGMLLVASGPEVHVHDLPTGKVVRKVSNTISPTPLVKPVCLAGGIACSTM